MNEIKACPFCGGKECMADDTAHNCWNVYCICGAAGPEGQSQEDAILRWNVAENQLDMLSADLAEAQEQARQAVMREAATHVKLQFELDALRKERDAMIDKANEILQAIDELERLHNIINSEAAKLRKERDEARRVARRLYHAQQKISTYTPQIDLSMLHV